ncbi:hypothetical protein R6Q57_008947 [Mikania cordata]
MMGLYGVEFPAAGVGSGGFFIVHGHLVLYRQPITMLADPSCSNCEIEENPRSKARFCSKKLNPTKQKMKEKKMIEKNRSRYAIE